MLCRWFLHKYGSANDEDLNINLLDFYRYDEWSSDCANFPYSPHGQGTAHAMPLIGATDKCTGALIANTDSKNP